MVRVMYAVLLVVNLNLDTPADKKHKGNRYSGQEETYIGIERRVVECVDTDDVNNC